MGVMAEIRGALAGGATKDQLEAAGYKRSSVYQAERQLVKPGDGRRRAKVRPADQVPAVRSVTRALPAPSSELSDVREQVALVKLGNDLAVAKQQAVRLQPEPPNEISNARAMIGLFTDIKALSPAPETPVSTPVTVNRENELRIDIARMEMEERNLIRGEVWELQQVEQKAELVKEVGGYLTKGLGSFLKVLQEVKVATPARLPGVPAAPVLNHPRSDVGGWNSDRSVWTNPSSEVPSSEIEADVILQKPLDWPGGSWIGAADAETGESVSWAWAKDPPRETVRERLQRIGIKAAGQNSSHLGPS